MSPRPRQMPSLHPAPSAGEAPPPALSVPPRRRGSGAPPPAPPARGRRRRRSWLAILLLWLPLGLAAAVVATVGLLGFVPPPTTAYMLQSPVKPVRYDWVPAERIAEVARAAVVASEDQKFWAHRGFDFEAIEQAMEQNRRRASKRGASTISQQTAKNLFLWPGGGYFRKGLEAGLTVLIETLWSKERILEVYLNVAEFGAGIYGVEAAARSYFGKSAEALTSAEAARLAAVLPSPRRWSARNPGPYVQSRSAWILRQMGYGPRLEQPEPAADPEPDFDPDQDDPAPQQPAPGAAQDGAPDPAPEAEFPETRPLNDPATLEPAPIPVDGAAVDAPPPGAIQPGTSAAEPLPLAPADAVTETPEAN